MAIESKTNTWITFIGVILVLIGIYGSVRTIVNLKAFERYPQEGVLNFTLGMMQTYYPQREEDCSYPRTYYEANGQKTRSATDEEKAQEKRDEKNCLTGVKEARERAKVNDISQSLLFLFLGVGVLVSRKIFFK